MADQKLGAQKADTTHGEDAVNIEFDPNVYQYYDDSCAFQSQALVLKEFGIDVSQEELMNLATEQGWYVNGYGTPIEKVGKLLEHYGVDTEMTYGNNIFNLANELAQGHQVIVGVDSGELWNKGILEGTYENLEDALAERADHALIVAGIDTSDVDNIKVILTDPGNGNYRIEYTEKQFMDAWKDSDCFMVATENAPAEFTTQFPSNNLDYFADIPYSTIDTLANSDIRIEEEQYDTFFNTVMDSPEDLESLMNDYDEVISFHDEGDFDDLDDFESLV